EVWAHGNLTVSGHIAADVGQSGGTSGSSWVDLFANGDINILEPTVNIRDPAASYAVQANGGLITNDTGGVVTIKSINGSVHTTGDAVSANSLGEGGRGGTVDIESGGTSPIAFGTASIQARGSTGGTNPAGGSISALAFNGAITGEAPGELNASGGP